MLLALACSVVHTFAFCGIVAGPPGDLVLDLPADRNVSL
jgi:hypothetical protein